MKKRLRMKVYAINIEVDEAKPKRVATNKKKATNFYTTANVKNRNRAKKVTGKVSKKGRN
jgi:nuclear GTP-binding protein